MSFLVSTGGPGGEARRVERERLRIGRGTGADLRFEDRSVALEHALVEAQGGGYRIVDLGSLTGTYRNGEPVREAVLGDGDVLGIGDATVDVRWEGPGTPLELRVRSEPAAAPGPAGVSAAAASSGSAPEPPPKRAGRAAAGSAAGAEPVDYLAAYRLERPGLSKRTLVLVSLLATLAAVAFVVGPEGGAAFAPGQIAPAHRSVLGAADCLACHEPWEGPTSRSCEGCHAGPEHQARQAASPPCGDCHEEHRGLERLTRVSDGDCVACHGGLEVADGGTPRVARRIGSFDDHPEMTIRPETAEVLDGEPPPALRLDAPGARTADPATIAFGHARHLAPCILAPESPAGSPGCGPGRVTLGCEACHRMAEDGRGMRPVDYEAHCASCHRLSYDEGRVARHAEPALLRYSLLSVYADGSRGSPDEDFRRLVRDPVAARRLERTPGVALAVARAERHLFSNHCEKCHRVDLETRYVAPSAIPERWLAAARFSHFEHRITPCETCHAGAATSEATEEVLLPGIAVCQGCHGGSGRTADGRGDDGRRTAATGGAARGAQRVSSACVDCHAYHRRSRDGSWEAVRGGRTPPGRTR